MIPYEIISTGSKGNAVVVDGDILVDCGVPFRALEGVLRGLKLVLLTHIHGDHFRPSTLRRLARERPTLRFGCCRWLVEPLVEAGVRQAQIDVMEPDKRYSYGSSFEVIPVSLVHDVPNCGYKIHFPAGKVIYATDTSNLNGITAPNYDLYLIEANYIDEEIREKIREKRAEMEFPYEKRVLETHLSKAQADNFIYSNIGPGGEYVYLHCHQEPEEKGGDEHCRTG